MTIGGVLLGVGNYIIASTIMFIFGAIFEVAGLVVMGLSAIPFCKSGTLSYKYKKLYNIKLKKAAEECGILSMHDSDNKEIRLAMTFGIK